MAPPMIPIEVRFWARVEPAEADECWMWTGWVDRDGYGRISKPGRNNGNYIAHRWVYEQLIAPIPDGLVLDHLCRVRACVNPWHLEPVTAVENVMRGESLAAQNARKTHCKRGHEFTPENTYRVKGGRQCRQCHYDDYEQGRWAS